MDRRRPAIFVAVIPDGSRDQMGVDVTEKIVSWEYQDCEDKADALKLTVDNYDLKAFDDPTWKKGNILVVSWGYEGAMAPPRRCVIDSVKGFNQLRIEAHGLDLLMHRTARNRVWTNVKYSDVAKAIASEWGYEREMQVIEETPETFDTLTQGRQSDAQFMARMAHKAGFKFYLDFDGFHFHQRQMAQPAHRVYEYFTDPGIGHILSISIENDITVKPGAVGVRGRNPFNHGDIRADALPPGTPTVQVASDIVEHGLPEEQRTGRTVTLHVDTNNLAAIPEAVAERIRNAALKAYQEATQLERQAEAAEGVYDRETGADVAAELHAQAVDARTRADGLYGAAQARGIRVSPDGLSMVAEYGGNYEPQSGRERQIRWEATNSVIEYMLEHPNEVLPLDLASIDPSSRAGGSRTVRTASETQEGANGEAVALYRRVQQATIQMKMEIVGDPTLLAKTVVEMKGLGRRLSGPYYISEVIHKGGSNYTCAVKLRSDGTAGYGEPQLPEVTRPTVQDRGSVDGHGGMLPQTGAKVGTVYTDPVTGKDVMVDYVEDQGRPRVITEVAQPDPYAVPETPEEARNRRSLYDLMERRWQEGDYVEEGASQEELDALAGMTELPRPEEGET